VEVGNHRVQKFTSSGSYISYFGGPGIMNQPYGICVDASGDVYVANTYLNRIDKYDGNGNFLTLWGSAGTGNGQFTLPAGIAAGPGDKIYVVDTNNHRVQKFGSGGTQTGIADRFEGPVGHLLYPSSPNPFRQSTRIQFDLVDSAPVLLQVFDFRGRLVNTLMENGGAQPGQFSVTWSGRNASGQAMTPGMYFFRLRVGSQVSSQKVVLLQ
jgi:DNA-binding beta-propeller fold protein YncE